MPAGTRYWVYSGYVSADHCDSSESPTYTLMYFKCPATLAAFRKEFEEETAHECSNVIFTVIEGVEVEMVPEQTVTSWSLKRVK